MNPLHNTFISRNCKETQHITKHMCSNLGPAPRVKMSSHNNTNADRHTSMKDYGAHTSEQSEAKMRNSNTVFFELAKAAHKKRSQMFADKSEYLDCRTVSCHEDFKSTISDISEESEALEILSTTSSSWHDIDSEIDGNCADEVTKKTNHVDKVTGFPVCVSEACIEPKPIVDTDIAFRKHSPKIASYAHNLTKSRSFQNEELSESETYYNDPQIDTLDIFKPERFGRNYFKTKIRSSKQRVSYECPEVPGYRKELDIAEMIFLSTNSGGLSPKVFESQYYEGYCGEQSNEGEVSICAEDCEGMTCYHSPENRKCEKDFGARNSSLPGHEFIEIKAKTEMDKQSSKLSFGRLVHALDALDKREKVSLLNYAQSRQNYKLCNSDEIKNIDKPLNRRLTSILDKISFKFANSNVTTKKPNRRKRKVRKHRPGVPTNRESYQKQYYQARTPIITTGNVRFNEIKTSQECEPSKTHESIVVCKKKNDNSNRIKTRFSRATSHDSSIKRMPRKTSPSPTQNISHKSPNRYGKCMAASNIQIGNECKLAYTKISAQECNGLNPLSTSSDVFKTVRENRPDQKVSDLNQSHSATKKNVSHIPPRPIPSDRRNKPNIEKISSVNQKSAVDTELVRHVSQTSFSKSTLRDKQQKTSDLLKNSSKDTFESVMETYREKIKTNTKNPSLSVDAKGKVGTSKDSVCQIKAKEKIDIKSKAIADVMKSIQARSSGVSSKTNPSGDNRGKHREPIKSALDLYKERNAPKQIQSSSKTDTRSEKADFRIASMLGKGRKFAELKRKGALLGTSDISLVKGDHNMNKDTASSNTVIGGGDYFDKFKYGRRLHEDLDKAAVPARAVPNPFRKVVTIPRLNFSSQKEGNMPGGIPRLSLDSSKLRDQRKILQEESKSLFKEVQDQFYRSNKLQQESGDIVKSVMYGEFHSPQKSPMKFLKGDFDADNELIGNKGPTEHFPNFLRDRVERPDTVRKLTNSRFGGFSSQPNIDGEVLEKPKIPSPIFNDDFLNDSVRTGIPNLSNYPTPFIPSDIQNDITSLSRIQFQGDRRRMLNSRLPEHQTVSPRIPRSTRRVSITPDTVNQALSTLNKECKYNPAHGHKLSNRKLISYNQNSSLKLGMSLPEVVSYKPTVLSHADVEPKQERKSSEKSRLKPTNNSGTSFILLRGNSMSKTENAKPEKMHKLGVTKPRTWSSLQSKQNVNVEKKDSALTASEHVPKASVVPRRKNRPNRAVVSLDTTGGIQEDKKPVVRTININSHHDSCTQTCKSTKYEDVDHSNIPKRDRKVSIQESKNSVSYLQTRNKITKSPRRRSISNTSVKRRKGNKENIQSRHKHASSRGNRYLSDSLEHTVSSSNIQSNKLSESSYEAYPPKAYLESATSFASTVTASRARGGASIPSSSIGSLNSSQFYEFIYPPKMSKQRDYDRVTPNTMSNGAPSESNWEPESYGKIHRNKTRTPPKWKLRNERKTDPLNTNERIWGWIHRSEETPSSMTDEYEPPRGRGHFDESSHAQEYNSNDPYPQRRESPGQISIHPHRRSSSLPSKLLARARAPDQSIPQGNNDYRSNYPSTMEQGRYTGETQDWSPMRSHASLSAKAYLQKYQSGATGNHRLGISDPGGSIYADVNHGHNPLESRTDETDRRFSDFENKVQNQISRRSQVSVARESNRHLPNSYGRESEDRLRSTMNMFSPKSNTQAGFQSETGIRRTGNKAFDVYKGPRSQQRPTKSTNTGYEPRYKSAMSTRDNSPTYQRSPYSLETGRPQNCSPCDAAKICSGEQRMYAWPPMFVSPQGQGNQYNGGYSKDPRLLAMMSQQPYRLTQKDLQCSEDDMGCTENYVIKKYSGVPGSCSDVVKCVRESYLKNMKLVVDGPGNMRVREPNYDAQGEFKITDNSNQAGFKVSLIPSPPHRY